MLIKYISSDGTVIMFNRAPEYRILKIGGLRDYKRLYKRIGNVFQFYQSEVREYDIEINCIPENPSDCPADKEFLTSTFESDCIKGRLGRLYIDDCFIHCNIFGQQINSVSEVKGIYSAKCQLVAKGGWICEHQYEFYGSDENGSVAFTEITDLPFDLRAGAFTNYHLANDTMKPVEIKLLFETMTDDSIENPLINIGNLTYKINSLLHPYESIEINPIERSVIKKNKINGFEENIYFAVDPNSYAFSPIPIGEHDVTLTQNLKATVTVLEERMSPEWK